MPASPKCFRTICGNRRPCRANTSVAWPSLCVADGECIFNLPSDSNRVTQRGTDHFLSASRPTFVLPRICNSDGQVVPAMVVPLLCTGRALGPVIARTLTRRSDVVQNAKFPPGRVVRRQLNLWLRPELLGHFEARDESDHLGFCDLPQTFQVLQLGLKKIVGTVEPVPPSGGAMDSQRSANSVTKFVRAKLILAGKHLDSFCQTGTPFYRHFKP